MSEPTVLNDTFAIQLRSEPQAAANRLRALGDGGDADANFLLAQMLVEGRGIAREPKQAQERFFLAANNGHRLAMNMLGRCHELGIGTPINFELALIWYARAANAGLDWGMYNLANLLATGRGCAADISKAKFWYQRAAQLGHAKSMNLVGRYLEQQGSPEARAAAAQWYRRAAEQGDFRGQANHASVLLEQGHTTLAIAWYLRAIAHSSVSFISHLKTQLSAMPDQVANALRDGVEARLATLRQNQSPADLHKH